MATESVNPIVESEPRDRGSTTASDDELPTVQRSGGSVVAARQIPFARIVVAWLAAVALAGGALLYAIEAGGDRRARPSFWACVFLCANCVTATGLTTLDVSALRPGSKAVLALAMQLGSAVLVSLVPILVRLRALRRVLPRERAADARGARDAPPRAASGRARRAPFDLASFHQVSARGNVPSRTFPLSDLASVHQVPKHHVEYKALVLLLRVVLAYQVRRGTFPL